MATIQDERLEKAIYTPSMLAGLSDALYEHLRGQMKRKKDIMLLDTLVMMFSYQVEVAQGCGRVPREINAAMREMMGGTQPG